MLACDILFPDQSMMLGQAELPTQLPAQALAWQCRAVRAQSKGQNHQILGRWPDSLLSKLPEIIGMILSNQYLLPIVWVCKTYVKSMLSMLHPGACRV